MEYRLNCFLTPYNRFYILSVVGNVDALKKKKTASHYGRFIMGSNTLNTQWAFKSYSYAHSRIIMITRVCGLTHTNYSYLYSNKR